MSKPCRHSFNSKIFNNFASKSESSIISVQSPDGEDMKTIAYIDLEVGEKGRILDIGAVKWNGASFHSSVISDFTNFISDCEYLCGHNIISHDIKYLKSFLNKGHTLYMSSETCTPDAV